MLLGIGVMAMLMMPADAFSIGLKASPMAPARRTPVVVMQKSFESLEIQEKVALTRATKNSSFIPLLEDPDALANETWAEIRSVYTDLEALDDATLQSCYGELKAIEEVNRVALPKPDEGAGLATGALPLAALALVTALSLFGITGGDVVCGDGATSRACVEQAARAGK